jgi:hypothetical protein
MQPRTPPDAEVDMPDIDPIDRAFAAPMWGLSLASLLLFGGLLHFYGHAPHDYSPVLLVCIIGSCVIYPVYWAELLIRWQAGQSRLRQFVWCCLLPPLRLGVRDACSGQRMWLPVWGWVHAGRALELRLQAAIGLPVLLLSVLVLPLLAVEHLFVDQIASNVRFHAAMQASWGLIWMTFAVEFLVMVSATDRKLNYCRQHWVDLAIILLPLLAFVRALRLGGLLRVQQMTKAYRFKGAITRGWRALLVLEAIQRLLAGPPVRRLEKLRAALDHKEAELRQLRDEIGELEEQLAIAEAGESAVERGAA